MSCIKVLLWEPGGFPGGFDGKESACNGETQVRILSQEDLLEKRMVARGNPACRGTFGGRRKAVRDRLALQGGTGDFP